MRANRKEWLDPIPLDVRQGSVPADLQGHVFLIGAVGFGDDAYGQGTPIFNGDGMIYRLDFIPDGAEGGVKVRLKSALAKTPCFFADEACQGKGDGSENTNKDLAFRSLGFGRFSPLLGLRNEVNTAFLPFKTNDGGQRLLITYDAGRPYEIDADSLKAITPVGNNREWDAETPFPCLFKPVLSTAHPVCDPNTEEVFSINYGRSIANILGWLRKNPLLAASSLRWLDNNIVNFNTIQNTSDLRIKGLQWLSNLIQKLLQWLPRSKSDFTRLVRWDGDGALKSWQIMVDDQPLTIRQTVHQMGLSRDYIVLADTSFQFGLEQAMMNPLPDTPELERLLQRLLLKPQEPNTDVYIINRTDLKLDQDTVKARHIRIDREIVHYACDYDNLGQRLTLCAAHNCASDVSVPLHEYDQLAGEDGAAVDSYLVGMVGTQMDIGKLGRYTIDLSNDGKAGLLDQRVIKDNVCTWGVGLYTHQDIGQGTLKQIYWQSLGYWPQLQTKTQQETYSNYPYREMSLEQVLGESGTPLQRPASLFRLDVEEMKIADSYHFPENPHLPNPRQGGVVTSSPQFVPRRGSQAESQMDGYVVCPVTFWDHQEIWIFDAADLQAGPVCRLGHDHLGMGYTLHTTWLPSIEQRTARYNVPLDQDYPFADSSYLADMPPTLRDRLQSFFQNTIEPKVREYLS